MRSLDNLKAEAALLLKHLHSPNPNRAMLAMRRFSRLPDGERLTKATIRHRMALDVIAVEQGYTDWRSLLAAGAAPGPLPVYDPEKQFSQRLGIHLNHWFRDAVAAEEFLAENDGFLFPYRHQAVVLEREALFDYGLDPDDPDWQRAGPNWLKPADSAAHDRLRRRLAPPLPPTVRNKRAA
jgi:hypothetical protein